MLSGDPYDSEKSTVSVTLQPIDSDRWEKFAGLPLVVVSLLMNKNTTYLLLNFLSIFYHFMSVVFCGFS